MNDKYKYCLAFLLTAWLLPCMAHAQYLDHRTHYHELDSLEQVLATCPPTGDDLLLTYRNLAWGYLNVDFEKVRYYSRSGIPLAEQANYSKVTSFFYHWIGLTYYRESQYDSTMFYYDKALKATELMKTSKNSDGKPYPELDIDDRFAAIYGDFGNLYNIQGKYHEAVAYYQKALKIFEKYGWENSIATVYYNIGEMYLAMYNYEQAEINYSKLEAIAHQINDSLFISLAKLGLSLIFLQQKDYDQALEYANVAYGYYFAHPEEGTFKVTTLNVLAEIYLEGYGNDPLAAECIGQALLIADSIDITSMEKSVSLRWLAALYLKRGEWRKAEQTALSALATDDSEPENTLALYGILAKAYACLGDAAQSAACFDKYDELQSSWSNKNYQSAIREMEVKYETEKKETEIATLKHEKQLWVWLSMAGGGVLLLALAASMLLWRWTVEKRRLAEQLVKQLEQEKQLVATQAVLDGETVERMRLARDLHDGLGGLLSATQLSLADLKKNVNPTGDNTARFNKTFGMLDQSMREMRRVAHHLMPDSLSRYGLKTALSDFCNTIPSVAFSYYGADNHRFDRNLEVVVYRIAHELINNSLKHADATHILVQIVQEAHRIALTVQDNGTGFDPETVTSGMGLHNIRTRVALLGGTINMRSSTEEGTEIDVEFKIES